MMVPSLHPVVLTAAWTQPEMLIPFGGLLVAFGGLLLATCQFLKSEIKDNETRLWEEQEALDHCCPPCQVYADPPYTGRSKQYGTASSTVKPLHLARRLTGFHRAVISEGVRHNLPNGWLHVPVGPQKSQLSNRLVRGTAANSDWDALWRPYTLQSKLYS